MNPYYRRRRERLIKYWEDQQRKIDGKIAPHWDESMSRKIETDSNTEDLLFNNTNSSFSIIKPTTGKNIDRGGYLGVDIGSDEINTKLLLDLVKSLYKKKLEMGNDRYLNNFYMKRSISGEIKYLDEGVVNDGKLLTFIMPVKNRKLRAVHTIKSIVNKVNSELVDFMIVEDVSNNIIDIPDGYDEFIDYHLVNTGVGDSWSRTKLLNYGIKRSKTPLCVMWDVDFLFPENFIEILLNTISGIDYTKHYFGIPSYETHNSMIQGISYQQGEPYGNLWVYPKDGVINVGGMNEKMKKWGYEDRELEYKFKKLTDIVPIYIYHLNENLMIFHYSHEDTLRGERNRNNLKFLKKTIMNNGEWGELRRLN